MTIQMQRIVQVKRVGKTVALAGIFALGVAGLRPAHAETVLTLSSWLPPGHTIVTGMIKPWMEQVKKATDGRVRIEMLAKPAGKPQAHFDLAREGIADITYSVHGYQPGRFLLTQAVEMPFLGNKAEHISVAYWRIHEKYLAKGDEHAGTKVLSVFSHGPGHIYNTKRPVSSLKDLEGLKMRAAGGTLTAVAENLGVVPLVKPASQVYELMSRGVVDGVFFPAESVLTFKIDKVVKYVTLVPNGLYNVSFFLVMNPDKFKALSKEDQEALMSVSGEHFARLAGQAWDKADAVGLKAMKDLDIDVQTASGAFVEEIKAKTKDIEGKWVAQVKKEKGMDGEKIMSELRAEIKKVADGQ